jgi:hypothetical protein
VSCSEVTNTEVLVRQISGFDLDLPDWWVRSCNATAFQNFVKSAFGSIPTEIVLMLEHHK